MKSKVLLIAAAIMMCGCEKPIIGDVLDDEMDEEENDNIYRGENTGMDKGEEEEEEEEEINEKNKKISEKEKEIIFMQFPDEILSSLEKVGLLTKGQFFAYSTRKKKFLMNSVRYASKIDKKYDT